MKKLNRLKLIISYFKNKIASLGWFLFIYFSDTTEEEYWSQIYEQEKNYKK